MATQAKIQVSRSSRVSSPKARASYPHVFKPTAFQGEGEPKFSISLLVHKSEKDFIEKLKGAQAQAIKELYPTKVPVNFEHWGIADGDEGNDEVAKGHWVIKASNKQRPRVVDAQGSDILDELEVYGGCYVRASLNAKAYGTSQKGGVTLELNVVQKIADGTPFGGAAKAMQDAISELGAYDADDEAW
jgi:hypothetical protein